jgi:uncharacterized RDD family membrane protein YckC
MTLAPGFGMEPTEPTLHPAEEPQPQPDGARPPDQLAPSVDAPELGSRGLRLVAYIFDSLLVAFVIGALWVLIIFVYSIFIGKPPDQMPIAGAVSFLISVLYFPFWWSRDGQTLAMMPLGLRVVDEQSEGTISFGRAVVRLIVLAIGIAVFFLGVLWTLVDKRRRGWHDLAAHTIVIGEK